MLLLFKGQHIIYYFILEPTETGLQALVLKWKTPKISSKFYFRYSSVVGVQQKLIFFFFWCSLFSRSRSDRSVRDLKKIWQILRIQARHLHKVGRVFSRQRTNER